MRKFYELFEKVDVAVTNWMADYGIVLLRLSLGIVFFWFGVLKFFPALSSAEDLATRTIDAMTFGMIPASVSIYMLATWECLIGIGLIIGVWMRVTLLLLYMQMVGTVMPIFLFPAETFAHVPYAPTLEGQYIIKNIVLVSAGLVMGALVRGGAIIADPEAAEKAEEIVSDDA